ncbi:MAG: tetratricopeptide repeat protein [Candidatus Gastranaerophilales bacterium]|nr:tetratricopeptide repeat protein [Candidatus Gastranaerophilales bacterium]
MLDQTNNTFFNAYSEPLDAKAALELARQAHEKYLIKLQKNDLNEAIDFYIKTIKLDPQMPETYYRLASLLWEDGQISLSAAIEQCKSAVQMSPDNQNARIYTGYFLNLAQKYNEAETEFKEAIKLNPIKAARPRLILSMMLMNKMHNSKISFHEFSESIYYFLSGSVAMTWDYASLRMLYKNFSENFAIFGYKFCGELLEKLRKYSLAIKTYDIAAEKTGRVELFYKKIGDVSIENDAPEIAIDSYQKALEANPYNRDILLKKATIIQTYFEDKTDDAIDCYNRIIEIEGKNERIYYELGHLYLKKHDYLNSVNAFKLGLEIDPKNAFYHNSLAYALVQSEQYDEAIEHYQIAINLNPDEEWTAIVCQALGTLHHKIKNNMEAAIALYQTSLVLDPKSEDAYIGIGDIYFENDEMELAIKSYCDAIKLNPESARAYSKCAMALWEKDYLEEAIVAYNKVISLEPEYEIAYNNLGVIYLDGIGTTEQSIPYFETAIDINPNYTLAYFNLARAQEMMGLKMEAADNFQMAANLNKITQEIDEIDIQERLFNLFEVH